MPGLASLRFTEDRGMRHSQRMAWLLAPIYDRAMRHTEDACLSAWRRELLAKAQGSVLEIGSGTGVHLGLYGERVSAIRMTEPDPLMRRQLERKLAEHNDPRYTVTSESALALESEDGTVDTVVSTLVLCTVPRPQEAMQEIFRVLKPGGSLLFLEHVYADNHPSRARWQRWVNPFWRACMGGCELTRPTGQWLEEAGFEITEVMDESMRRAPKLVRRTLRGCARKPI